MAEPLKDKNKIIQKEIISLLAKHRVDIGVVTKIISKLCRMESNRKSAVEYLRDSACMRRGCKYRTEKSKIKVTVFKDRCPNCETSSIDTSDLNEEWKKSGRKYGFGNSNTLDTSPTKQPPTEEVWDNMKEKDTHYWCRGCNTCPEENCWDRVS
ncbi:hypothetical protein LCGC14_1865410 [marine sediment metagenome]|uniref:Uncharacterized protein n=1 Tax=marine sediment metagenome TaxID=412755 RepID=A0A0F9IKR8_9ZZZZ